MFVCIILYLNWFINMPIQGDGDEFNLLLHWKGEKQYELDFHGGRPLGKAKVTPGIRMNVISVNCENIKWIDCAQDKIQWWILI
jgi:hypothetical protein